MDTHNTLHTLHDIPLDTITQRPGDKAVSILTGLIVAETERAILISYNTAEHWFPLSTVHEIHRHKVGDKDKVGSKDSFLIDNWILKKKFLID
jgi:hypothetical protein